MTNKIMELADALITASTCLGPAPAFAARIALQAEVTWLEAELAQAKEDFKILQGHFSLTVLERNALLDKLAALEAQEPAITVRQKVFENGVWLQHQKKLAAGDKLYLAAGAKENQVGQSCAGYGNHALGDAPCNVCWFTGRKP